MKKTKGKDEKEIPYYLGGFDTNFIIFMNVRFSKLKMCEGKY
jgi:hypothetical protein